MRVALKNCEWFKTLKEEELAAKAGSQYHVVDKGMYTFVSTFKFKNERRTELLTAFNSSSEEEFRKKLGEIFVAVRVEKRADMKDLRLFQFVTAVYSLLPPAVVDADKMKTLVEGIRHLANIATMTLTLIPYFKCV